MEGNAETTKTVVERWREARENLQRLKQSSRGRDEVDLKRWKKSLKEVASQLGGAVLAGDVKLDAQDFEPLVKDLKSVFEFGTARTLIEKFENVLSKDRREWFWQQRALCTYKDEELIPAERFKRALAILDAPSKDLPGAQAAGRPVPESPETLGLRGAVYKRMWEFGGQPENLYRAADCYLKAWERDPVQDKGYGGVNAAYLMDVLAGLEKPFSGRPAEAMRVTESWSLRARRLREDMKKTLTGPDSPENRTDYFFCVTMAEIHWGLEEWDPAAKWLELAGRTEFSEWELQTTAKQLVAIARLHGVPPLEENQPEPEWHPAWRALKKLTAEDTPAAVSNLRGKVGLALSGGGFRASLFHLGVLARLAEMDVLRSVEVLSTVSGGSIVGAHYYLWLRSLLMERTDGQIGADDYVALVKKVQDTFLAGIRENLRTRGLSNLICNLKFVLPGSYTRSNRMGELYEDHIYAQVEDRHPKRQPRRMRDLLIHPLAAEPDGTTYKDLDFNPKYSNWRRRAKVPILLLNTTSLNTGHNWHFTARWMGEPPGLLGPEAETIPRYRRLWYDEAPTPELQDYRLGYAVAASARVPALFEPLELRDLYPDRTVRLVDGGVHDNQGVAGLFDESCTLILCSDASGQMADKPSPSNSILGVPLRSNSILMDRVRESQYLDLRTRVDSHALQGLFFVHLKQELSQDPVTWIGGEKKNSVASEPITSYGVDRDVQAQLAAIRTDLDSFSEVEAFSLMASGYLMAKREFEKLNREHLENGGTGTWGGFEVDAPSRGPGFWKFLEIAPLLALPLSKDNPDPRRADLGRQLKAGASRLFKAFKLCRGLSAAGIAVLALIAFGLGRLVYQNWNLPVSLGTVGHLMLAALFIVAGMIWSAFRIANPQAVMRSALWKSAAAIVGWVLTNFHLHLIDGRFIDRGKLERLLRLRH
jgi:predicted acylesterase/phospholipase RssA